MVNKLLDLINYHFLYSSIVWNYTVAELYIYQSRIKLCEAGYPQWKIYVYTKLCALAVWLAGCLLSNYYTATIRPALAMVSIHHDWLNGMVSAKRSHLVWNDVYIYSHRYEYVRWDNCHWLMKCVRRKTCCVGVLLSIENLQRQQTDTYKYIYRCVRLNNLIFF